MHPVYLIHFKVGIQNNIYGTILNTIFHSLLSVKADPIPVINIKYNNKIVDQFERDPVNWDG